jgi:hypothetical protein
LEPTTPVLEPSVVDQVAAVEESVEATTEFDSADDAATQPAVEEMAPSQVEQAEMEENDPVMAPVTAEPITAWLATRLNFGASTTQPNFSGIALLCWCVLSKRST